MARRASGKSIDGDGRVPAPPWGPPVEPRTGVCVVRVQQEGERLRYRVAVTPDISVRHRDVVRECRDLGDTLRTVQAFLMAFEASGPPMTSPPGL